MAKSGDAARPIIKRKKVINGGGHHGGAWKVAYADFVTAMMAFFLLMWLLNATSEEQKKGIADYFSPTLPISRTSAGGDGLFSGKTIEADKSKTESGIGSEQEKRGEGEAEDGEGEAARQAEDKTFSAIENLLRGDSGESEVEDELLSHVSTRVTDEGLIIEFFDREGPPLFTPGRADPSLKMQALAELVGEVAGLLTNPIAIEGHTDALPFAGDGYGNWDLSTDRAQATRRLIEGTGLPTSRIARVTGKGSADPAIPADPLAPQNRRIVLTFLRQDLDPGR